MSTTKTRSHPVGHLARQGLAHQGYHLSEAELARYSWPLRFTPVVTGLRALGAVVVGSTPWLLAVAAIAAVGAAFASAHPLDLVYNHALRRILGGDALPEAPLARRGTYLVTAAFLLVAAVLFKMGALWPAYVVGALVVAEAGVVAFTGWSPVAWVYARFAQRGHGKAVA